MAATIVIPRLGWSMEQGTFLAWLKQDGDVVRVGEPLFELEGEKSAQEVEAVDAGILRIPPDAPRPGSIVEVGSIVGYLVTEGEPLPWLGTPGAKTSAEDTGTVAVHSLDESRLTDLREPERHQSDRPRNAASPRARRVARELGIDWTALAGRGASGRVRERDVRAAAAARPNATSGAVSTNRIRITPRRRLIAERLKASRQHTVPVTLTTSADVSALVQLREQWKVRAHTPSCPSYQDMIVALVAALLPKHPLLASRWEGDEIVVPSDGRLGIGFAVDTTEGLLVAVVPDVSAMSLSGLAERSRFLAERARAGRLTAAEMEGSAFTVTNLGAFGIDAFTPVIHDHHAAILGLGTIRREPTFLDDGQVVARHRMVLSLTFDHRIVDGAPAARFLQDLATAIGQPPRWLIEDEPPSAT